jgi:hypothetical protein
MSILVQTLLDHIFLLLCFKWSLKLIWELDRSFEKPQSATQQDGPNVKQDSFTGLLNMQVQYVDSLSALGRHKRIMEFQTRRSKRLEC